MSGRYAFLSLLLVCCFYVSSVHSQSSFERGERIPLIYNKIFSHRTLLPYSYASLPFICPPYTEEDWSHKSRMSSWLAVDQDWFGDYPILSDYKVAALEDVDCHVLCTRMWSVDDAKLAKKLILDDYQVDWWLDGLPGATASYTNEVDTRAYRVGFPLGQVKKNDQAFINNHVTFNLLYIPSSKDSNRIEIVGFEVYPDSVANGRCTHTSIDYAMQEVVEEPRSITFTYSVRWKEAKQPRPERRWDMYIIPPQPEAHFYSIINSIVTVLILCFVVAVILLKTSKRDHDESDFKLHDDFEDVIGWRLIHRDVFRRPIYGGLLAPIIGSGVQLLITVLVAFGSILTGYSHPARAKDLLVFSASIFTLAALVAGYYSARIYKAFRGKSWTLNAILTSTLIPSIVCAAIVVQNILLWWKKSSLIISFRGWLTLSLLWLFALVPLTFIGAFIGEQRERIEHPVRPTQMPRYIPSKRWYQRYGVSIALGGVIPFAVIFVDVDELLRTIWQNDSYLSLFYASMACLTYGISVSAVTIALIFFQLCSEDYHWWWMSFGIGGSSSLYIYTYAMFCYWTKSEIHGFVGGLVYMIHTLLACTLLALCTGALGFLSAYSVVRKIYAAVKVD